MANYKMNHLTHKTAGTKNRPAVTLLLTIVILVVLTSVVYSLAAYVGQIKNRQQYIIDYQKSRYACDSAIKYALAAVEGLNLKLINREDTPDFSDLFTMTEQQRQQYVIDWAIERELTAREEGSYSGRNQSKSDLSRNQRNSSNDPNFYEDIDIDINATDPNMIIPGPYGPPWPYVNEPIELEIGNAKVTIKIEDENAKLPLTWTITDDKDMTKLADNALETFCEWMQMDFGQVEALKEQLKNVNEQKPFKFNLKPVTVTEQTETSKNTKKSKASSSASSRRRQRRRRKLSTRKTTRPTIAHTTDFAKLLHSSIIDLEALATPLEETGSGDNMQYPLKYLALWGSKQVNINTAPRHVLEAAFAFGGDAEKIADEIITVRQTKPFKSIDELKSELYAYNDSIEKTEPYITTKSTFLAIKVTAKSGNARTSAVATVIKNDKKVERIAIITNNW